jgi:hypothetical protein
MPSTTSSVGLGALGLFDRDDALLADLLHRLAMSLPMVLSPLALMVPTWAISFGSLVGLRELLQVLDDDGLDALVDAALDLHRVVTGGDELRALAEDRLGEHGGRRGAVAGHVARLRRDLAHHLGAHVLELVLELDLLGDGDAVLGDRRASRSSSR